MSVTPSGASYRVRSATEGTDVTRDIAIDRRHRLDVQGMRGIAVLLVVLYHAGLPVPGGFTGVDVFFVISGFVITGMLARELELPKRGLLLAFYSRRIRRLLPALSLMLVVAVAAGVLLSPVAIGRTGSATGIWASLFSSNLYLVGQGTGYFDPSASLDPLLHTWTLAVEEQFYLGFPLVLLLGWYARRRWGAATAIAVLSAGSFAFAASDWTSSNAAFLLSPARAWEFGAGSLIALAAPLTRRLPLLAGAALGACGFGLIGLAALTAHGSVQVRPTALVVPVAGACLLLVAGSAPGNLCSRFAAGRPLTALGEVSYSWYLWHWPLIVFAGALWPASGWTGPVAAAVSLLPAWASYRFVEQPVRYGSRFQGRRVLGLAAACIALPIGVALAAIAVGDHLDATGPMRGWAAAAERHADYVLGCDDPTPLEARPEGRCRWRVPGARGTVALVGDSNAGQYTEAVIAAARRAGLDTVVTTHSSCPFVAAASRDAACDRFAAGTLAALVRERPNLVVLATRSDNWVDDPSYSLLSGGARVGDPPAKAVIWEAGTRDVVAVLNRAGIPVIVVHANPRLPLDPRSCAVVVVLRHACGGTISRAAAEQARRFSVAAEVAALRGLPSASSLDFVDALCSPTECGSTRAGVFLYFDAEHLSIAGALTLTDRFEQAIRLHARS